VEPVVQLRAQVLHSAFLLGLRILFVLHDDLHGLAGGRAVMRPCCDGSKICGELTDWLRAPAPSLREGCLSDEEQQNHAEALSPGSAVALTAFGALFLYFLQ
jgi:hypothetical protein